MLHHIVLIRFRTDVEQPAIDALFVDLHRIEGQVAGLIAIRSGRSESPEQMEHGFLHGFVADFTGWDALQAYQDHPAHRAVGAGLVAAAEGGKDGILVFDLPFAGAG